MPSNTPMAALWYGMPYRDSVSRHTGNAFWEEVAVFRYLEVIRRAGIATYFWGNWQDEPTGQSILSAANTGGRFLAGPGSHCVPPPGFDFTGEVRRYFDQHLKGIDPGAAHAAARDLLGRGRRLGPVGQPARHRRTATGTGIFPASAAAAPAPPMTDRWSGSPLRPDATASPSTTTLPSAEYFAFWARPMDAHGLSYTSPPLAQPLRLIGFPVARIVASVDRPDAHLWVYLDQIDATGQAEVIAFGRLAFSHHRQARPPYRTLGLPWHSGRARDVGPVVAGSTRADGHRPHPGRPHRSGRGKAAGHDRRRRPAPAQSRRDSPDPAASHLGHAGRGQPVAHPACR